MLDSSLLLNLDNLSSEDLRKHAERLWELEITNEEDDNTRSILINYAIKKADAMDLRATGKISQAQRIETRLDSLYFDIPDYACW